MSNCCPAASAAKISSPVPMYFEASVTPLSSRHFLAESTLAASSPSRPIHSIVVPLMLGVGRTVGAALGAALGGAAVAVVPAEQAARNAAADDAMTIPLDNRRNERLSSC